MTKNSMTDLNAHLFAQLDRLSKPDLTAKEMEKEAQRSRNIVQVADAITANAQAMISAANTFGKYGGSIINHLPQISNKPDDQK